MSESHSPYPSPQVPVNAILSFKSMRGSDMPALPSILDVDNRLFPTSGRVAIALALTDMGIGEGDEVLVPAYHCLSMVEPITALGAKPVFYKIKPGLDCDLDDIQAKLTGRSKVLMAVHFFGFPQDLGELSKFCAHNNLSLLEDCSHAFFGEFNGRPLGSFGDYAIASPPKFFPLFDGGCLVSDKNRLDEISLESAGLWFQLKAIFRVIERAVVYGRLQPFNIFIAAAIKVKDFFWTRGRKSSDQSEAGEIGPSSAEGGLGFDPAWMHVEMSRPSQALMRRMSTARVIGGRRRNYQYLADALRNLPGGRALLPDLPDHVVPYIFPFEVDDIERVFPALKMAGVPIYRWEDVPGATCDISSRYSQHLLQFPCHQELRDNELKWIAEKIRKVLHAS